MCHVLWVHVVIFSPFNTWKLFSFFIWMAKIEMKNSIRIEDSSYNTIL